MDDPGPVTAWTGSLTVEGEFLRTGAEEMLAAFRTDQFLSERDIHRRRQPVTVRASVAPKTREHQAQAVQQFCPGAEGGSDAGDSRTLVQREGSGDIEHLIHIRLCRLCQAAPCVG